MNIQEEFECLLLAAEKNIHERLEIQQKLKEFRKKLEQEQERQNQLINEYLDKFKKKEESKNE
jgi:predicted nuclease with TOPRIM domain